MSDLRTKLSAAAAAPPVEEFDEADVRRRARGMQVRRGALTAFAVLLVAGGAWAAVQTVRPTATVEFAESGRQDTAAGPTEGWSALPESPLRPRSGAYAAWTGDEFVVWGGFAGIDPTDGAPLPLADGAAYNPATKRWRMLAAAPLTGMHAGRSVWTGDEFWIVGGSTGNLGFSTVADAAAYAPDTDSWRELPDVPALLHGAAWSPETSELVAVGPGGQQAGSRSVWALGPDGDAWRALPDTPSIPGLLDPEHPTFSLAVGGSVAYLVTTDATWQLDLRDPVAWQRLVARPGGPSGADALDRPDAVWTVGGLVTVGREGTALYDPAQQAWTALPAPPTAGAIEFEWFDSTVLSVDGSVIAVDQARGGVMRLDVVNAAWEQLATVPLKGRSAAAIAAGTGGSSLMLLVWSGDDADNATTPPSADGALLQLIDTRS